MAQAQKGNPAVPLHPETRHLDCVENAINLRVELHRVNMMTNEATNASKKHALKPSIPLNVENVCKP